MRTLTNGATGTISSAKDGNGQSGDGAHPGDLVMPEMSAPLDMNAISAPRAHYEHVVRDTLRILWVHKVLVAAVFGIVFTVQSVAFMLIAPRYTGEAIINLDFTRNETATGDKVQSTASVDAAAIVTSAARIVRSRGTASEVVSVLRLDKDPAYSHQSLLGQALSAARSAFGMPALTPHDVAVSHLMRQTTVTNDPRSYLITVAVTASDPERAARLANWIGSEYLRGRLRQQAIEAYAAAEREMSALSSVFGPRHPKYLSTLAKLENLKAELAAAREEVSVEDQGAVVSKAMIRYAAGQSLLPAQAVMVPSGPNAILFFTLTTLFAVAVGILLSMLAERGLLRWPVSNHPGLVDGPARRASLWWAKFAATATVRKDAQSPN